MGQAATEYLGLGSGGRGALPTLGASATIISRSLGVEQIELPPL